MRRTDSFVAALTAMLSIGTGVIAAPVARLLQVSSYNAYARGVLTPILSCDGGACVPDMDGVVEPGLNTDINDKDIDVEENPKGFEEDSNTSGGLKDGLTTLEGSFGVDLNPPFENQGTTFINQSAEVNALFTIGPAMYSATLEAHAEIRSVVRLSGLPNDLFAVVFQGGASTLAPSDAYDLPGAEQADGRFSAGDYSWSTATNIGPECSVHCATCPAEPGAPPACSGGPDSIPIIQSVVSTLLVERDSSQHRWRQPGPGIERRAWAFLAQGEERIIVGGTFEFIGAMAANRIAAWDGQTWSLLGAGVNGGVRALVEFNGGVVAGGGFTTAGGVAAPHVAFWNGSRWAPMGDGLNRVVRALAVLDGVLYAGGEFIATTQQPFAYLARWDAAAQEWVGVVDFDGPVFALAALEANPGHNVHSPTLYVGGDFSNVGGLDVDHVVILGFPGGGLSINPIYGVNGPVNALATGLGFGGSGYVYPVLFAGGEFTGAGFEFGVPVSRVARWDTEDDWEPLGAGANGVVHSLLLHSPGRDQVLIAGGSFTTAGGQAARRIARWDADQWSPMGDGFNNDVGAVGMFRGEVFATGDMTRSGALDTAHIARWSLDGPPCPGDADGNGFVGFGDLNVVLTGFNTSGAPHFHPGDLDGDGFVGFEDLNIVLSAFNTDCPD